jgi:D-amino-acid dehydrogenase
MAPRRPAAPTGGAVGGDGNGKSAVVIGGGLVGVCTAYFLRENGYRVTVLDEGRGLAESTSFANAGRFCPTRICTYPLASPKVLSSLATYPARSAFKWASAAFSSLTARTPAEAAAARELQTLSATEEVPGSVQPTVGLVQWGLWFLRNCTSARFAANNCVMRRLAHVSSEATGDLLERLPGGRASVDYRADNLWVYGSEGALRGAVALAQEASLSGFKNWATLDREACARACPPLAPFLDRVARAPGMQPGCLLAHDDYSVDAHKFALQVARLARAPGTQPRQGPPVRFIHNARVTALVDRNGGPTRRGRVAGARYCDASLGGFAATDEDEPVERVVEADHVVVCAGPHARAFLRAVAGANVHLQAMKGCSVELLGVKNGPAVAVADYLCGDLNFQATPVGADTLRLVGFADIESLDEPRPFSIDPLKRESARASYEQRLVERAKIVFPDMTWTSQRAPWCGLRPLTPDGLPILGTLGGFDNLWLNLGHGSIGWTLAAGTGLLLTRDLLARDGLLIKGSYVDTIATRYGLEDCPAMHADRFSLASFFLPTRSTSTSSSF